MTKQLYLLTGWLLFFLLGQATPGRAQYATANLDGAVSAAEYSGNVAPNGSNWYMTWNADNLYIAKIGGYGSQPHVVYLDLDPALPVTGGGTANGNVTGVNDYGVVPNLPFRADVRVYFTDTYIEIRRRTGTIEGTWGDPIYNNLSIQSSPEGTTREIRLGWNTLTGGGSIPPTFNWLAYAMNQAGGNANERSDLTPTNPAAQGTAGGATPNLVYYNTVASTANGSATKPFSLISYTFIGGNNVEDFGAIQVWDFTMNTPGVYIRRSTAGGDWNIGGSLVVGSGQVLFGNDVTQRNYGATNVHTLRVVGTGVLDMESTSKSLNVSEDVLLSGGQFRLSGVVGGDLTVGRHFRDDAPNLFVPNKRAVTFAGTGVAHTIMSSASANFNILFDYLTLDSPNGSITLNSSIKVAILLNFYQGLLYTGSNSVQLDGSGTLGPESAASHIMGAVQISQAVDVGGSGTKDFGNIGFSITPNTSSAALGYTTVTRVTGTTPFQVGGGSNGAGIQRYFTVAGSNSSSTSLNVTIKFVYRLDELNGIPESRLALYRSPTGTPPYEQLTTPPSANTTEHSLSQSNITYITSGTRFAVGDGVTPLPVTLVSFGATPTAQGAALLRWVTASELNNKGFGIERQLDGTGAWLPVGYVAATGRTTGSTYEYTDKSLPTAAASAKQAYYRLRQEDHDGTTTYSPVAVVARQAAVASGELALYPVPATGPSLSVALAEAGQAGLEVSVTNAQGQRLLNFTTQASTDAALTLPVEQLGAGVYIVSVRVPGQGVRHARFVRL